MNIDQPLCSFNYCKKYADGNCRASVGIREGCEFRVYEEKQIPKEPIVLLKDEDGYAYQFEHYLCPDCKNIFAQRPQGSKAPLYTPKYCLGCGQALKWD